MASRNRWVSRGVIAALLTALAVVMSACGITGDQLQSANQPEGSNAESIWNLFIPIFWLSVIVFVVVQGMLIWAIIKFRYKSGDPLPAATHGNTKLEVAWTIAPALILAVILVPTITTIADLADEQENAYVVKVTGHQWWWEFEYPDEEIVTGNVMHLPVDRPIRLEMTASDVLHSFYAPRLFGKQDTIPGRETYINFTPQTPGEYYGQCYEFCGLQHAKMKFRIIVHGTEDYQAWVDDQSTPPEDPEEGSIEAQGKEIFLSSTCVGCHTIDGTEAQAGVGPNLTNIGDRSILGAGILENTSENLAAWIRDPHEFKQGVNMPAHPGFSEEEMDALVAYLESLK